MPTDPTTSSSVDNVTMSPESLRPQFFVTRQNGNMVPLIAMDELPSTINIRNVSRSLSPYDISGMTGIGTYESRHLDYVVDIPDNQTNSNLVDRSLMASKYASPGREHHLTAPSVAAGSYQGPAKAYGIHEQAPISSVNAVDASHPNSRTLAPVQHIKSTTTTQSREVQQPLPPWHDPSSLPSSIRCGPGVKEYCSYWLRHGECDYAQQGCLYKHEMPLDLLSLQQLGLRDIPKWYRERHGLGSYHAVSSTLGDVAMPGRINPKSEMMGKDWRKAGMDKSNNDSNLEGLQGSVWKMAIRGEEARGDARHIITQDSGPVCPPSPQMSAQIPARYYYANQVDNKRQSSALRISSTAARPAVTMQQQQNRITLEEQNRYEREQKEKFPQLTNVIHGANKLPEIPDRPQTNSSTSTTAARVSRSSTPGEIATPATSTEASDSDNSNPSSILDAPVLEAKTPVLQPVVSGQAMQVPKSTSLPVTAPKAPAKDRHAKKKGPESRRRLVVDSDGDAERVGERRKGSVNESKRDERRSGKEKARLGTGQQGGYDHDD